MTRAQGKHREFSLNQSVATLILLKYFYKFEVNDTARKICSRNGLAYAYECDVSSYQDVRRTANKVRASVGHPDIVVSIQRFSLVCLKHYFV